MHRQLKKVVVIGVGLIGGSFCLALKKRAAVSCIVGVDRHADSLETALNLGIIDIACADLTDSLASALDGADLIVIATPVAQTESILREIYPHLQSQTIVTDAGSTKAGVVKAARRALAEKIGQFVPAHPIAGRELNGPEAAIADLYKGKKVVITALPENNPAAVKNIASVWQCCGAVSHYMTPEQHDHIFSAVSHLPHLLAYALVDQISQHPEAECRFQYAASGFRDFTRIAGSSPEMWRDISLANRDALLIELAQYQSRLEQISLALQHNDGNQLLALFSNAQTARQHWIQSIEFAELKSTSGGN